MDIIPAIDIKEGRCVRLKQGDFNKEEVYGNDPVEMALYWQEKGVNRIHVVDLDGAKEGHTINFSLISEIVSALKIPVQVGGGIRTIDTIKKYLESGVDRVILGTVALKKPGILKKALKVYGPDRVLVGVDVKQGKVAVEGWIETTEETAYDTINKLKEIGVKTFIYTDISRDGMLSGPNLTGIKELAQLNGVNLIASGGISSNNDIKKLKEIGINSAIVGKALYKGRLKLGG